MKCDYCGATSHEKPICPWVHFDKIRPEYDRWKRECEREREAALHDRMYIPNSPSTTVPNK